MSQTDTALLALRRAGRPEGFSEIVRRYTDALFRYCARRLKDRQLAEDAVQETFLRAWKSSEVATPTEVAGWLFGTARNCCLELVRRRGRAADSASPLDEKSAPAAPEHSAPVESALDGLEPEEQALLQLKHSEGLTCREIAALTGRPLGTVTSALTRAYARLRGQLAAGRTE